MAPHRPGRIRRAEYLGPIRSLFEKIRVSECIAWNTPLPSFDFDAQIHRVLVNEETGCVVKGGGPQRGNPPGNWFAPPGSNQSSSGGNETAEASGAEGR